MFQDRQDAADRLADALTSYAGRRPLILAIPRGAVPMARILADRLGGEFDVVLVRKIGSPFNPEVAVGAVDEAGHLYVAPHAAAHGADAAYLDEEARVQRRLMAARRARYTPARAPIDPVGRTVIVVDDGLATGATMIAALHAVRAHRPQHLVCAVPVAAPESLARVRSHADEVVCLWAPAGFHAVAAFYRDFPQVTDEQVIEALRQAPRAAPQGEAA